MWFKRQDIHQKFIVLVFALYVFGRCEAITNAEFNEQIRGYSVIENNVNLSDVKTMQKHGPGLSRYANSAPVQNTIRFRDSEDSVVSGSSYARGLLHHGHTGYSFDYEEPIAHHGYDYPVHDNNHYHGNDYHHYEFHDSHHPPHGYGHGHHKYYDHGLAHKALLWPIAGIALLGAAAALVTNPVLLQLGVVSGKRRRRQIDDIENTAKASVQKWSHINSNHEEDSNIQHKVIKKKMLRKNDYKDGKQVLNNGDVLEFKTSADVSKKYSEDRRFVPIPLLIRKQ